MFISMFTARSTSVTMSVARRVVLVQQKTAVPSEEMNTPFTFYVVLHHFFGLFYMALS